MGTLAVKKNKNLSTGGISVKPGNYQTAEPIEGFAHIAMALVKEVPM